MRLRYHRVVTLAPRTDARSQSDALKYNQLNVKCNTSFLRYSLHRLLLPPHSLSLSPDFTFYLYEETESCRPEKMRSLFALAILLLCFASRFNAATDLAAEDDGVAAAAVNGTVTNTTSNSIADMFGNALEKEFNETDEMSDS